VITPRHQPGITDAETHRGRVRRRPENIGQRRRIGKAV
jgi:hypothetical protein